MTQPVGPVVAAGWYPDQTGVLRYWDGAQWLDIPAPPGTVATAAAPPVAVVAHPTRVVTEAHKKTSHGLHLFLTIITGGVWGLVVWLPITLWHRSHKGEKTVTYIGA